MEMFAERFTNSYKEEEIRKITLKLFYIYYTVVTS